MNATFTCKMDLRGLEPPGPMTRILETLATAPSELVIEARLERKPMFLIQELERRGHPFDCAPSPDGGWMLTVKNPPSA